MTHTFAIEAQELLGQTGMGNYTRRLVRAVARIDGENSYVLPYYRSPRRRLPVMPLLPHNFKYKPVRLPIPVVARLVKLRVMPPWDRLVGRLDACLFTGSTVVPLRRGKNVRMMYDLNPILHPDTMVRPSTATEWAASLRDSLRHLAAIVAISETVKHETTDRLGFDADRIVVAPPGVDRDLFRPSDADAVEAVRSKYEIRSPYVLFVGMLEPRKRVPELVRAFAAMPEAGRGEVELVLAGPPAWGWAAVERALEEAASRGVRARALGHVPTAHLVPLYSGSELLVCPSRYEGFGMPVVEAMACGAPVLASDIPVLREVGAGATAHVDPDHGDLTAAMADVLGDAARRAQMRADGLRRAADYDWNRSARAVVDTLQRVASE